VPTVFTYRTAHERAAALTTEHGARGVGLDLRDGGAIRGLIADLERAGSLPRVLVHCAAESSYLSLDAITEAAWDSVVAVNAASAFIAAQSLALALRRESKADPNESTGASFVFVGALDRSQSVAAPVHFAASQGMLSAMTMALAKELGPEGIRVNMVALGPLEGGLSAEITPELLEDYTRFSALRRLGTPDEAARAILWLALESTYMSGKLLAVNGGL
jgi:3-oxoacyl-[acyl-carrier protein] reductase